MSSVTKARYCATDRATAGRDRTRGRRLTASASHARPIPAPHAAAKQAVLADRAVGEFARELPLRITRTRSASDSTVSGSVESTITAMPSAAQATRTICTTSSFAPTSMPRVGSTSSSALGGTGEPFRHRHLLLIAAGERAELRFNAGGPHAEPFGLRRRRARPLGRRPQQPARNPFKEGDRDVADRSAPRRNNIARRLSAT